MNYARYQTYIMEYYVSNVTDIFATHHFEQAKNPGIVIRCEEMDKLIRDVEENRAFDYRNSDFSKHWEKALKGKDSEWKLTEVRIHYGLLVFTFIHKDFPNPLLSTVENVYWEVPGDDYHLNLYIDVYSSKKKRHKATTGLEISAYNGNYTMRIVEPSGKRLLEILEYDPDGGDADGHCLVRVTEEY